MTRADYLLLDERDQLGAIAVMMRYKPYAQALSAWQGRPTSSLTSATSSAPTPDCGQPSSAVTSRCVLRTELTMVSRSSGFSVRRLITCAAAQACDVPPPPQLCTATMGDGSHDATHDEASVLASQRRPDEDTEGGGLL